MGASLYVIALLLTPLHTYEQVCVKSELNDYAKHTWNSVDKLTSGTSALPADTLLLENDQTIFLWHTSPTNIAAYIWATISAHDLHLIPKDECIERLTQTLSTVKGLEKSHGFLYNWYDSRDRRVITEWWDGTSCKPFLSTIDNGWLILSLILCKNAHKELTPLVNSILDGMDLDFFLGPPLADLQGISPSSCSYFGGYWPDSNQFTLYKYDVLNTETRILTYLAAKLRTKIPTQNEHYSKELCLFLTCDGSAFEALMPTLFVEESANLRNSSRRVIEYMISHCEPATGAWGSSFCYGPNGYQRFGYKELSLFGKISDSVVSPHVSFLCLHEFTQEALDNLFYLRYNLNCYSDEYGFYDSVCGRNVTRAILCLDQAMIMAALNRDNLVKYFRGD